MISRAACSVGCTLVISLLSAVALAAPEVPAANAGLVIKRPNSAPGDDELPANGRTGDAPITSPRGAEKPPPLRASFPTGSFNLLGESVAPGHQLNLTLRMGESFAGAPMLIPVTITHGTRPGPAFCLVAGIHGDELNGVEIVRRTVASVSPQGLRGTLIGLPIANLHGLQRGSRYLPDRRDLNRFFPGSRKGSAASRIADVIFRRIVRRCDLLIDFHTASHRRTNLPQLRANLGNPSVVDLAVRFGDMAVIHNEGRPGTLRRAATDIGITAVTYEAGEPLRFDEEQINRGVGKVEEILANIYRPTRADRTKGLFWRSRWVRVDEGGIFMSRVTLGEQVSAGDVLGSVTNPLNGHEAQIRAPHQGKVIGMALNQVVIPGFATFHLGIAGHPEIGEPGHDQVETAPEPPPEDDDAS